MRHLMQCTRGTKNGRIGAQQRPILSGYDRLQGCAFDLPTPTLTITVYSVLQSAVAQHAPSLAHRRAKSSTNSFHQPTT